MTEQEFLAIINNELDNLQEEYRLIQERINFYKAIKSKGKDFQDAMYRKKMIIGKIEAVKKLVNFPAYARIQAMSDAEVEKYKEEKISDLELKIQLLKYKQEDTEKRLSELKAVQSDIITRFGHASKKEREKLLFRGQRIQAEIDEEDIVASIQEEIQQLINEQQQIRSKTSEQIKAELSAEIKNSNTFEQLLEKTRQTAEDDFTELLSSVALEPEKARQMADLLAIYKRELTREEGMIKVKISSLSLLPLALKRELSGKYDPITEEVWDPEELIGIVEKFEKDFTEGKKAFEEEFTKEKLYKLIGKEHGVISSEVDMPFLEQHREKLPDGKLEQLQSLIARKDKLSKKVVKTKETKTEIESLKDKIDKEQSKIYRKIIACYELANTNALGLTTKFSVENPTELQRYLVVAQQEIEYYQKLIERVKEQLKGAKKLIDERREQHRSKRLELTQQIINLGGESFAETDIRTAYETSPKNQSLVIEAAAQTETMELVDKVQQEAQIQADKKEAEIKGVTIEELKVLKEQLSNSAEEVEILPVFSK